MAWVTLCETDELAEGRGKYVEIDGYHLAVYLEAGIPTALDDRCPHAGASLSGGSVDDGCAICPVHGWAFRLSDGTLKDLPQIAVSRYECRLHEHAGKKFIQANLPMP